MFTKQQLTPHALELFAQVKRALPSEIAMRLRSNRKVVNHGNYANLFLFDVWDSHQTDVLDRKHFKYCLGYRPNHPTHYGYFHLWLNRIRIYRQREDIITRLDRELPKIAPEGFTYHPQWKSGLQHWLRLQLPKESPRIARSALASICGPNFGSTSDSHSNYRPLLYPSRSRRASWRSRGAWPVGIQ